MKPDSNTGNDSAGRMGYSEVVNTPEFLSCVQKRKKKAKWVGIVFTVLLPFVGAFFGAIALDSDMGAIIGAVIGVICSAVLWARFAKSAAKETQPPMTIDGTITGIRYFNAGGASVDSGSSDEINVRITLTDSTGREHRVQVCCNSATYDYYKVGERVRYHDRIDYLEKHDKSYDSYTLCALCKARADINADRCPKCSAPLLK